MVHYEVTQCAAVGNEISVKSPSTAQKLLYKRFGGTAGFTVHAVIGAHHAADLAVDDSFFKGGEIGFKHILFGHGCVKRMTARLRPAVHSEVLGAGGSLYIARRRKF